MIIVRKEKRKKWKGHRGGSRYRWVYKSRYDPQVLDPPSRSCLSTLPLLWSFSALLPSATLCINFVSMIDENNKEKDSHFSHSPLRMKNYSLLVQCNHFSQGFPFLYLLFTFFFFFFFLNYFIKINFLFLKFDIHPLNLKWN